MSLSGSAPSNVGEVTVQLGGLPSPGETTLTRVGEHRYQIDSFFDVFTEISVDGGPFEPVNPPPRLGFNPAPSGLRCDNFNTVLLPPSASPTAPTGPQGGGGSGWNNGEWICYPEADPHQPPWYNQWFYNDPLDPERWKEIWYDIRLEPLNPTDGGDIVEVAINWSNDLFPNGTGQPPMPNEEQFIERRRIFLGDVDEHILIENSLPEIIEEYNPEWVSIDIRYVDWGPNSEGISFEGDICHECVPEPATMSLLALGGLAVLRRRRRRA
jgi:hypothetical protein